MQKHLTRKYGEIDFVVHCLAFADKSELEGDFIDTSREGFAMANGFNRVLNWNEGFFTNKNDGTMWGKFDHIMFDKLLDIADEKGDTPFMINFFTTTSTILNVSIAYGTTTFAAGY